MQRSTFFAILAALCLSSGALLANAVPVKVETLPTGDGNPALSKTQISQDPETPEVTEEVTEDVEKCTLGEGFAYTGSFLDLVAAQNAGECCEQCSADDDGSCGGFAFEHETLTCILFEKITGRDEDAGWTSGVTRNNEDGVDIPDAEANAEAPGEANAEANADSPAE